MKNKREGYTQGGRYGGKERGKKWRKRIQEVKRRKKHIQGKRRIEEKKDRRGASK